MKTRYLTKAVMKTPRKVKEKISLQLMFVTFVLAVLVFAVSPVSAAPPLAECDLNFCDQDGDGFFRGHKKCACEGEIDCDDSNPDIPDPLDCDGGSGGGGDNPAEFTAALVLGAFRFGAVAVTLNKKGNSYSSTVQLDMVRPSDSIDVPADQQEWGINDQTQWDAVFSECFDLFFGNPVGSIMPSDNWSIDNGGPKNAGAVGSNIRIQFRDVIVPGFPGADLDLGLIGVVTEALPPISGSVSVVMKEFSLFGAGEPPISCKSGTLDLEYVDSVLEITRKN